MNKTVFEMTNTPPHSRTRTKGFTASFEEAFRSALRSDDMPASSILVAFSGGADSAVLLSLLAEESRRTKFRLAALHVNHQIRGQEAERDAEFCRRFCEERKIPFVLRSVDVPMLAQEKRIGLEEAARIARYRALNDYAREENFSRIATAHNATDQIETVLFHLIRGAALRGGGGMAPILGNRICPLLSFPKTEIERYAQEKGLPFVTDSTNADTNYTRNYIRHEILPRIYKINPRADEAFSRFAAAAREDDDYLYRLAVPYRSCDSVPLLASLDSALLHRVLLIKLRETANNEITEKHLAAIETKIRLAAEGRFCGRLSLPGKRALVIDPNRIVLCASRDYNESRTACRHGALGCPARAAPADRKKNPGACTPPNTDRHASGEKNETPVLLSPGERILFEERYLVTLSDRLCPAGDDFVLAIPKKAIQGELRLRKRREGDAYRTGRMTKKVKKLLCEKKVPVEERAALPFVCDDEGILYIPYLPPADRILSHEAEEKTIFLTITRIDQEKGGSDNGRNNPTL